LVTLLGATALWAWPWSRDLVVQLFTRPQQNAATPPPGTVSVGWEAPLTHSQADGRLRNPLASTPETRAAGQKMYVTYCQPCHGATGRGNGPVAGGAMLPADLTTAQVRARSDGYLYATVRNGVGLMPAYGTRMTPEERWQVVLYLRTLTEQGSQ
jgi:mono/diheme cytochrome c family protein